MSPTLVKVLVAIGAVLTLGALFFIAFNQIQIKNQQSAIQSQLVAQQQLVDGIMRSQSQYATAADLAKFASDNNLNLKAIQDNLNTLNSKLAAINVISANSTPQNAGNLPSSNVGPANPVAVNGTTITCPDGVKMLCPFQDPYGYQKFQQSFTLNEAFGNVLVPFGTVGFSAWQKDPWNVSVPEREYNVDTVVGVDENERQTFYNKFTVKVNNQSYNIPIKTATTKQQVPTASFSLFNPRLLMGLDGGVNVNHVKGEFTPTLNLGIASYGQFKTSPDFSILEVGVGYQAVNKTAAVVITPVAYNLGKQLFSPVVNNTYIAPSVSVATDGSVGVGLGVRVGF